LRGSTTMTMGQRAHHLGTSLAPALPNPLLGRGIGASSLPAPPLVTTRAGTDVLAQGAASIAWSARGCGTRLAPGYARHTGHGSGRARTADFRGDAELPQRDFRLNRRPGRARRLPEAGRHWAPIARQRATREERHSGRTWPTYCKEPNGCRPSGTACCVLSSAATAAVQRKPNICICGFFQRPALAASCRPALKWGGGGVSPPDQHCNRATPPA
jgi:hypothetical protein